MPPYLTFVTRFSQLLFERKFAEAERILERLASKMHKKDASINDYNQGYLRALKGILSTQRSNSDNYAFFPNLNLNDKDAMKKYHREFLESSRNKFHKDYDRGFFSALADFLRVILKMELNQTKDVSGGSD